MGKWTLVRLRPIALATGAGSDWKNGLAWAFICGLISSMLLSLIVVPVVYWLFDRGLAALGVGEMVVVALEV